MTVENVAERIRAEFEEMPGLVLTMPQASRFFGLDQDGALGDGASGEFGVSALDAGRSGRGRAGRVRDAIPKSRLRPWASPASTLLPAACAAWPLEPDADADANRPTVCVLLPMIRVARRSASIARRLVMAMLAPPPSVSAMLVVVPGEGRPRKDGRRDDVGTGERGGSATGLA